MMRIQNATVLHMDCMEYMRTLPDKAFDLAIVDPPYGIWKDSRKSWVRKAAKLYKPFNDREPPTPAYFKDLQRISRNQIIWGANHFMQNIALGSSCWIVWDKINSGDFAECELAYTSFETVVRKFSFMWNGTLQGDMRNKEHRIHPTQKPVKLYEWLLTNYAKPGQRILDTHLGSGSSAIACNNLGFEMVGCELDEDYYKAACDRIQRATEQMRLFA